MKRSRRRPIAFESELLALFYDIIVELKSLPTVTLAIVIAQTALYIGFLDVPWDKEDVCLSAQKVIDELNWKRFIFSVFEHGDGPHLHFNMAALVFYGKQLEKHFGSANFTFLLTFLLLLTNSIFVGLATFMSAVTGDGYYEEECGIGFSGVLFALQIVSGYEWPDQRVAVAGITLPGQHAAWLQIILISLMVPDVSFFGHLAGSFAGFLYCYTPFGTAVDACMSRITGKIVPHRTSLTPEQISPYRLIYFYLGG